jgi:hypothetical protein
MCSYEPDQQPVPDVIDDGNQPVIIAANVEHEPVANEVYAREIGSDLRKALPLRFRGDLVPAQQRFLCVGMSGFNELPEDPIGYHPHISILSEDEGVSHPL